MTALKSKHHQIRLSGDPEFQSCLRQARLILRRLGFGEGHLNNVGALSLHVTSAGEIIERYHSGRFSIASSLAVPPDPRSLVVSGVTVQRLARLRSEMIARSENALNLRAIVHYVVCVLAEKDDKSIMDRLDRAFT